MPADRVRFDGGNSTNFGPQQAGECDLDVNGFFLPDHMAGGDGGIPEAEQLVMIGQENSSGYVQYNCNTGLNSVGERFGERLCKYRDEPARLLWNGQGAARSAWNYLDPAWHPGGLDSDIAVGADTAPVMFYAGHGAVGYQDWCADPDTLTIAPYSSMTLGSDGGAVATVAVNLASCSGWMGEVEVNDFAACYKETWEGALGSGQAVGDDNLIGSNELRQVMAFHDSPGLSSASVGAFFNLLENGEPNAYAFQLAFTEPAVGVVNTPITYTTSETSRADAETKRGMVSLNGNGMDAVNGPKEYFDVHVDNIQAFMTDFDFECGHDVGYVSPFHVGGCAAY